MDKGRSFSSEEELRERRKKKGALPLAVFLSFNDRDVHPHCPNASNPYHKCGRHCLDKIPSSKLLDGENSGGSRTEREKISDRWGECLCCPFASNPLHKCAYYCFEKMMDNCRDVREEPEKGKEGATVADKHDVNPNSELVSFEDVLKDHPEEVMKTRGEKIFLTADKQFNSECKNASNPFHVCAEYCFQKAPERDHPGQVAKLKRLKEKKNAFSNGDITGVNPQCKYASNPFHRCAEHCFQNVFDKEISGGGFQLQEDTLCIMDLYHSRFCRSKSSDNSATSNLYVANCGPAVGISFKDIKAVFGTFGEVTGIHAADESGTRVIVCFSKVSAAQAAFGSLNGRNCSGLGGRTLHLRYSVPQLPQKVRSNDSLSISLLSSELAIPGIYLVHDFITLEEEQMLLAAVDDRPWKSLSKRRVQHYGYEFLYETRNVDSKQFLGELPSFLSPVLEKILLFHGICGKNGYLVDQLTVNEYLSGIGLSPHIDTHSAFDDIIFSLSLAGSCIMEFRKYRQRSWQLNLVDKEGPHECLNFVKKAIFLPSRSMIFLSGEGRYAWHHYIPHHKVDIVRGDMVRRSSRRVSFTFRKVRTGPCRCEYPQYCDSQMEA